MNKKIKNWWEEDGKEFATAFALSMPRPMTWRKAKEMINNIPDHVLDNQMYADGVPCFENPKQAAHDKKYWLDCIMSVSLITVFVIGVVWFIKHW